MTDGDHYVVLVCGSRSWQREDLIRNRIALLPSNSIVINGNAGGADMFAANAALDLGLHVATVPALWNFNGKSAGPKRNAAMLALGPELVIAFRSKGPSPGTDNMLRLAWEAELPFEVWSEDGSALKRRVRDET